MADAFINPEQRDAYSGAITAGPDWWKGAPVKRVLMVVGNDEVFRDDVMVLGSHMKTAGLDVVQVKCVGEMHVECLLDASTGLQAGEMSYAVWGWLQGVFE